MKIRHSASAISAFHIPHSTFLFILTIILSIYLITSAHAASLRCGVRLITVGDFKARVLAECGEPDHVEVWEEEHVTQFRHHPGYYGIYENFEYSDSQLEKKSYHVKAFPMPSSCMGVLFEQA